MNPIQILEEAEAKTPKRRQRLARLSMPQHKSSRIIPPRTSLGFRFTPEENARITVACIRAEQFMRNFGKIHPHY